MIGRRVSKLSYKLVLRARLENAARGTPAQADLNGWTSAVHRCIILRTPTETSL
jgi:hypothetical protein